MAQVASDRFGLADSILREALDLAPEDRSRFVHERCGADRDLGESLIRLIAKFDQLGDFLETPAAETLAGEDAMAPGALLGRGRFAIVSFIGRGGMGEVYLAEDRTLGVRVALKTVRRIWCADRSTRERFCSEIRLSRQISHPNICRIFDLFEEQVDGRDLLFFTMEYLEGETLAARLARGPVEFGDVLRLSAAVAEGLAAAHRQGIVHCDLKPANIMLTTGPGGDERVVIMDFGLATRVAAAEDGAADELVGSPDYMAPEQFLGTAPTPATDVYALAAIVYEMAAGKRPFSREPLLRMALRRVSAPAPDLRTAAPGIPDGFAAAVRRGLARDAAERYQSPLDFVHDLRGATGHRIHRRLAIAGIAGVAVSSLALFFRLRRQREPVTEPVLMIMPTIYAQNDERSRSMAQIMDLLLGLQLSQSGYVKVLRPERIEAVWRLLGRSGAPVLRGMEPRMARQIVLRAAAERQTPFVLYSNIAGAGDRYSVLLALERVSSGPDAPAETKSWHRDIDTGGGLPQASHEAADWVRTTIGESRADLEARNRRPEELTTSEWQALQEYELAETAWKQNRSDAAILHLQAAIELDPDFAFAEARLADHLLTLGRPDEAYAQWARAADLIRKRNLTDRESLSIRGRFALDVGLYSHAEEVFSRYLLEYPGDAIALFYKCDAVARQGRPDEALHLLDQAIQRDPQSLAFVLDRAALALERGDAAAAEREWQAAAQWARGDWMDVFAAGIGMARNNFAAAEQALLRLRGGSAEFQSRGFALLACFRAEQGNWAEAEALLRQGTDFDRTNGLPRTALEEKQRLLAELCLTGGRRKEAVANCQGALANVSGLQMRMRFGAVLARAGDVAGARRCLPSSVPPWPAYQVWAKRLEGEIALAGGQPAKALALMKEATMPAPMRVWSDHVARAALAAHDDAAAGDCLADLLKRPGLYWLAAEQNTPAMLRFAVETVERLGKWPALDAEARRFGPLLGRGREAHKEKAHD
jgi:tetratricopeptide (TPR) repeat protein/tRNA A-37 threonylcarbamoyl transferase component Bud32